MNVHLPKLEKKHLLLRLEISNGYDWPPSHYNLNPWLMIRGTKVQIPYTLCVCPLSTHVLVIHVNLLWLKLGQA